MILLDEKLMKALLSFQKRRPILAFAGTANSSFDTATYNCPGSCGSSCFDSCEGDCRGDCSGDCTGACAGACAGSCADSSC